MLGAGRVRDAQKQLTAQLRDNPTDAVTRTSLFELLCFSGDYERAKKQLAVLEQGSNERAIGTLLYKSALHAETERHELFRAEVFPDTSAMEELSGTVNGKAFGKIRDIDEQIGARLEIFVAGSYMWLPFEHIESIDIDAPTKLRDTLWATARIHTNPTFRNAELGEALLPVIYPFSWKSDDENVWLGRRTEWVADDKGHSYPVGQRMLWIDGEEVPFLEIRRIEIASAQAASS